MERCLNLWMWNEWGTHLAFKRPDRAPVKWFAARVEERLFCEQCTLVHLCFAEAGESSMQFLAKKSDYCKVGVDGCSRKGYGFVNLTGPCSQGIE